MDYVEYRSIQMGFGPLLHREAHYKFGIFGDYLEADLNVDYKNP